MKYVSQRIQLRSITWRPLSRRSSSDPLSRNSIHAPTRSFSQTFASSFSLDDLLSSSRRLAIACSQVLLPTFIMHRHRDSTNEPFA